MISTNPQLFILIAVLVGASYIILRSGSSTKIVSGADGRISLKMHILYGVIGNTGLALSFIFWIAWLVIGPNDKHAGSWILLLAVFFFCISVPIAGLYKNHRVEFDDESITVKNFWGRKATIKWKEISSVHFQHLTNYLVIDTSGGIVLKVHQHLKGFKTFVDKMESQTHFKGKDLRIPSNF